jgi:predicted Zn-dependent peptidase
MIEGDDSLAHQELVQKQGLTAQVQGGINYLGNMFNYKGPMLFMADLRYDAATKPETIVKAWDTAVEPLRAKSVDKAILDRARVKLRSDLYDNIGSVGGFGLADLLASFALFDDNPARINTLVSEFDKVTPELIQKTAQEYLKPENRTVLVLEVKPEAAKPAEAPAKN